MAERIRFASTTAPQPAAAMAELASALAPADPALVLVFHSPSLDAGELAAAARTQLPGVRTAGCTTQDELWGGRFHEGSAVAVAFCAPARAAVEALPDLRTFRFGHGAALVGRLAARLDLPATSLRGDRHLLLTLTDGLSGGDERLLRSLFEAVPGVPLVGGNAGDGTRFERTWTWVDGEATSGGGLVVLLEPGVPFRAFATHHLEPTGERVVVTGADPEQRLVTGLNGFPALVEYGRLLGREVAPGEALGGHALHFGLRGDDGYHLRAVMAAREEGLVTAGAVAEGEILHLMRAGDLVASTERAITEVLAELPPAGRRLLLFHCGGRSLAAQATGVAEQLARTMSPVPAAGFSTYGEHYGPQLVNLTLSGVAFGHAGPADSPGFALLPDTPDTDAPDPTAPQEDADGA